MRSVAIGRRGVIIMWLVTAGKASHNACNARGVTAGKMGRNSSDTNYNHYQPGSNIIIICFKHITRTVEVISRDDQARIATCRLRPVVCKQRQTDRFKENYNIDGCCLR